MVDIGWIFSYLTKNRELEPGAAARILHVILQAVRDTAERGRNEQ